MQELRKFARSDGVVFIAARIVPGQAGAWEPPTRRMLGARCMVRPMVLSERSA